MFNSPENYRRLKSVCASWNVIMSLIICIFYSVLFSYFDLKSFFFGVENNWNWNPDRWDCKPDRTRSYKRGRPDSSNSYIDDTPLTSFINHDHRSSFLLRQCCRHILSNRWQINIRPIANLFQPKDRLFLTMEGDMLVVKYFCLLGRT